MRAMRALLTPEVAPRMGVVLFRPGKDLMPLFRQGRVLVESEPESLSGFSSGLVPAVHQPLAEDPIMLSVFENPDVIQRAGGLSALEYWLLQEKGCQWPHSSWHDANMTTMRHEPGAIRLCYHCDNQLREHFTERLAAIARVNLIEWLLYIVRRDQRVDDSHVLTLPEFCWWMVLKNLAGAIPEEIARRSIQMPEEIHQPVMRESDIVPMPPAREIMLEKVKQVVALNIDPESPESFMLRPKHRRWENPKYTRWAKAQPCVCCNQPADDPHHLIGYGQGGMGTKAHDLFVIPLCRAHHDELHADIVAFENKYGTQPELLLKTLDRALAIGVLA